MSLARKPFRKKPDHAISAVQLNLDLKEFSYHKWGADQHCKPGDWIVDNDGDVYTVDQAEFKRTYCEVDPGRYIKTVVIWAHPASNTGSITTLEGQTHYQAGDYLVANEPEGEYVYAVSAIKFEEMYETVKNESI